MSLISLTTDFGSFYPAFMKAVILRIDPDARIVDVTHTIPQADIRAGAFAIYSIVPYFSPDSIHVGVVDPGVGTSRRSIVIDAQGILFVGPDNGLMIPAAKRIAGEDIRVYEIKNENFMLEVSATFHGRDIFAPVSAYLSRGASADETGERIYDWVDLDFKQPVIQDSSVSGEVIFVDDFGNIISNIPYSMISQITDFGGEVIVYNTKIPFCRTYGLVDEGNMVVLIGSHGFAEIAINQGNAAKKLGISSGDRMIIEACNDND